MQIHRKWDLNRAACHPYLCSLCTWHGKIMWNCGGVIAGLERCEGQGFCSKELKVTMKTHRVEILGVWTALISTCHIHASNSCLDFRITFCILLEGRRVKSWTGFLYLKKHRCHEHWVKCDFCVGEKQIWTFLRQISQSLPRLGQGQGHWGWDHTHTVPSLLHCVAWWDSTACHSSLLKICLFTLLTREDTGLQSFHAYKQ